MKRALKKRNAQRHVTKRQAKQKQRQALLEAQLRDLIKGQSLAGKQANKTAPIEVKSVSPKGVVSGVLNAFDHLDSFGEITVEGAFKKSLAALKRSGFPLVMLWNNDPNKPIGIWQNLRETKRGLEGDGHLNLETSLGREAYSLAKQGALTGIAIGYWVVDEYFDPVSKVNYLKELDLREASFVTFPSNEPSQIETVKTSVGKTQSQPNELDNFFKQDSSKGKQSLSAFFREPSKTKAIQSQPKQNLEGFFKDCPSDIDNFFNPPKAKETTGYRLSKSGNIPSI